MSGRDIENFAKRPGSMDGDLIAWSMVKDCTNNLRTIRPSMASFSGWFS